jgi:hypothetical protein
MALSKQPSNFMHLHVHDEVRRAGNDANRQPTLHLELSGSKRQNTPEADP